MSRLTFLKFPMFVCFVSISIPLIMFSLGCLLLGFQNCLSGGSSGGSCVGGMRWWYEVAHSLLSKDL